MIAKDKAPAAPSLAATPDASLALAIISEFLTFHQLQCTASTAAAEIVGWGDKPEASAAAAELRLPLSSEQPLLMKLIQRSSSKSAIVGGASAALPTPIAAAALPPPASSAVLPPPSCAPAAAASTKPMTKPMIAPITIPGTRRLRYHPIPFHTIPW